MERPGCRQGLRRHGQGHLRQHHLRLPRRAGQRDVLRSLSRRPSLSPVQRRASNLTAAALAQPKLTGARTHALLRCVNATSEPVYYVAASSDKVAACAMCDTLVGQTIGITLAVVAGMVLVGVVLAALARKCTSRVETAKRYWTAAKPEAKIKIIAGFCEPDASPKPRSPTRASGA